MNNVASIIISAALPALREVVGILEIFTRSDVKKLNVDAVKAEIEAIKSWHRSSSEADWSIVKKGKKK